MNFTNYKYTIFSEKNKGTLENAPLPIYVLCFFQIETLLPSCNRSPHSHRHSFLCVDIGVCGIGFDKFAARIHIVAHQHRENLIGLGCVV